MSSYLLPSHLEEDHCPPPLSFHKSQQEDNSSSCANLKQKNQSNMLQTLHKRATGETAASQDPLCHSELLQQAVDRNNKEQNQRHDLPLQKYTPLLTLSTYRHKDAYCGGNVALAFLAGGFDARLSRSSLLTIAGITFWPKRLYF